MPATRSASNGARPCSTACTSRSRRVAVDVTTPTLQRGGSAMKWITRENVHVDRVACPWLIRRFVDPQAEFLFVPADQVMAVATREGATPCDGEGVGVGA